MNREQLARRKADIVDAIAGWEARIEDNWGDGANVIRALRIRDLEATLAEVEELERKLGAEEEGDND
jgi:hypothetical protein